MSQQKSVDDLDFLQELINTPEPATTPRARKKQDIRDQDTWFKLDHSIMGVCSRGENCIGKVLYDKGPDRVTAIVNEVEMCRYDFLDGLAKVYD